MLVKARLVKSASVQGKWLNKPILNGRLKPWLINRSSLTANLRQRYLDFKVQPVDMCLAKPAVDEVALLGLSAHKSALIREVLLLGCGQFVVFAHSVLPKASMRGKWNGLSRLGSKPLGEMLFANPKVKRAPLSYRKLSPHQALYQKAAQHLTDKPAYLWARRSVFRLNCATILVTEVFLPNLLK